MSSCQAGVEAPDNAHAPPFPPRVLCLYLVPKYPAIGAGRRASPQETRGKQMKNGEGIGSERRESRSACVHWQVSSQRSFPGALGSVQIPVCHYSQSPCPSQDTQYMTLRSEPSFLGTEKESQHLGPLALHSQSTVRHLIVSTWDLCSLALYCTAQN